MEKPVTSKWLLPIICSVVSCVLGGAISWGLWAAQSGDAMRTNVIQMGERVSGLEHQQDNFQGDFKSLQDKMVSQQQFQQLERQVEEMDNKMDTLLMSVGGRQRTSGE